MHIFAVFLLLNFNLTAISCKTSLQNEPVQKYKFHIDWKHDRSQIVILKHQHVGNQFLLISLIMCHQHHQWNELVCLKQNQVCIHCPSCLEHFSSTKRGRRWKRWSSRRRGGQRGQGLQWRRKRRENNVWQSRNLPLHWDMIGFSLVQEWPKTKSKWCS